VYSFRFPFVIFKADLGTIWLREYAPPPRYLQVSQWLAREEPSATDFAV
jgi:hypothetical protein